VAEIGDATVVAFGCIVLHLVAFGCIRSQGWEAEREGRCAGFEGSVLGVVAGLGPEQKREEGKVRRFRGCGARGRGQRPTFSVGEEGVMDRA
jgi:hypothetical protein